MLLSSSGVLQGMGELHLDIIVDRLRREYNVDCDVGAPQVRLRYYAPMWTLMN